MARRAELVMPAADPDCLRYALAYGADAVHIAEGEGFSEQDLIRSVAYAHGYGMRVYLALAATDDGAGGTPGAMYRAARAGVDGLILGDLGLVRTARDYAPGLSVFLSERAAVTSPAAARTAAELGVGHIVLPRTMTLSEIALIRRNTPRTLEFGVYIYGALRLGRLPQGLIPARGALAAPPLVGEMTLRPQGGAEQVFRLEERGDGAELALPGCLNVTALLDRILDAGVGHVLVEAQGRDRIEIASLAAACRAALDAALSAPLYVLPDFTRRELDALAHRPYTEGFFPGRPPKMPAPEDEGRPESYKPLAVVTAEAEGKLGCAAREGTFRAGEALDFLAPGLGALPYIPKNIWDGAGRPVRDSAQAGEQFWISAPSRPRVPPGSILRRLP